MSRIKNDGQNIAVIGAGVFGTVLAGILAENNPDKIIEIWSYEKSVSIQINSSHVNSKYFPELILPENVVSSSLLRNVAEKADIIFLTTPAKFSVKIMESLKDYIRSSTVFVICTKGVAVYRNSYMPVFPAAESIFGENVNVAVASGPSHVDELLHHKKTSWILASRNNDVFDAVDRILSNNFLILKKSSNPLGTELGGILKNVAAVLFGIIDQMPDTGDNFSGIVFSECMREIYEIFTYYGAGIEELLSESGAGDLAATCFSSQSRNRKFGEHVFSRLNNGFKNNFIFSGFFRKIIPRNFSEPELTVKFLAEGAFTIRPLIKIANSANLKIPLFRALFDVLSGEKPLDFIQIIALNPGLYFTKPAKKSVKDEVRNETGKLMTFLRDKFHFFKRKNNTE
ncbi:MAG: hypothetical protein JW982_15585 [Spirochaetes bacterium]|nr:hypothetical protein [Spirochaetota bacterium]